jgi:DNA helicase-2/ATP-dependent DNA helicase PcrA
MRTRTTTASPEQQQVFDEIQKGKGNIAVQATAGSGKSYTLLESLKIIPRLKKTVFLSFSNAIVNELKERVPSHVKACTLHSLGCRMIMAKFKGVKINKDKYYQLALAEFPKKDRNKETYRKCFIIVELCNYARLTLTPFNEESLRQLCDQYMIDADPESILVAEIILKKNTRLKSMSEIDFADMIYFPAVYLEIVNETFDYVCLDESQDCNAAQCSFIMNILKSNGRLIAVGDHFQSIYGFTGSSVNSFKEIQAKFTSKVLPLTVTYRCSKKVVELAQTVYPEVIQAHPEAIEGEVRQGELKEVQAGDMILCRNTRPLIACFFELIAQDKKAYIVGKDYEKGLIQLAESVVSNDAEQVIKNIDKKLDTLIADLKYSGVYNPKQSPKYQALLEKCEIIELILTRIEKPGMLVSKIQEIFREDVKAIRLMTIHRSKGLESNTVFFIETFEGDKLLPSKYAVQSWQVQQENNLLFVCYTRAKEKFIILNL